VAQREVEELGAKALVLPLDVADASAIDDAAARIEAELGPIDVWVNNAMVSVFSPVKEMTAAEYKRVTEVTYLGYVYGTMAALRYMLKRDEGVIVQVGSALASRSIPLQSAYCASKHAIAGFTESLRCELLHDGSRVKVSMVQMPALNTTQFGWVKSRLPNKPQPVPPIYQPEVAARAILWAAQHAPRELEVGYPTVEAILGEKLMPGLLDQYLADHCYRAQQTDEPVSPNREDNLWDYVPGDHGAHGPFGARSKGSSRELWLATHKPLVAGLFSSLLAVGLFAVAHRTKKQLF
jgi:NAD(P)-dependent dehydrogenase (short-subunit alcohol dehydrogenase family)